MLRKKQYCGNTAELPYPVSVHGFWKSGSALIDVYCMRHIEQTEQKRIDISSPMSI